MVYYECFRCGYNTKQKTHFINHLNRKNICNPIEDDVEIEEIKNYYGFEIIKNTTVLEQEKPAFEQVKPVFNEKLETGKNQEKPAFLSKKIKCTFCDKFFTRQYGLTCHLKTCKKKKEVEMLVINQTEENIKTQKETENMKEEIEELKEKIIDLLNKNKMLEIKLDNKTDELDCNYRQCMSLNKKLRKEKEI